MFEIGFFETEDHTSILCIRAKRFTAQPAKIDLKKKYLPKQKSIQNFNINAQGFRKKKEMKIRPRWK